MSTLDKAKQDAVECLKKAVGGMEISADFFERPPDLKLGDLAFPCFALAKSLKKAPAQIAADLTKQIIPTGFIDHVEAVGPYVNFFFKQEEFIKKITAEILEAGDEYGKSKTVNEKILIEYLSPNTLKEIHVGHVRNFSTALSIIALLEAVGNKVTPVNYINDSGAHIAKILWAYEKFHLNDETPENKSKYFGTIYAESVRLMEENAGYKDEVANVQKMLDVGDKYWKNIWEKTRALSFDEMKQFFAEVGMRFEKIYFSSEFDEVGKQVVVDLLEKNIAKRSQGAVIIDLDDQKLGVLVVLKSDGSPLYATQDLGMAPQKFKDFDVDVSMHVVDSRQSFYFKQLFATLKLMGFEKKMVHIPYEFVTLPEGAMSSRKGNIVTYQDFRDELLNRAEQETKLRHADWSEDKIRQNSKLIADGAMKFGMLKQDTDKSIVFDFEEAMSFDGFTSPYIQYAHARMCSILEKAKNVDDSEIKSDENINALYEVLRQAAEFKDVIIKSATTYRPNVLAEYLFDFAKLANGFYRDVPIIKSQDRENRLKITQALSQIIKNGLNLLGIDVPKEM